MLDREQPTSTNQSPINLAAFLFVASGSSSNDNNINRKRPGDSKVAGASQRPKLGARNVRDCARLGDEAIKFFVLLLLPYLMVRVKRLGESLPRRLVYLDSVIALDVSKTLDEASKSFLVPISSYRYFIHLRNTTEAGFDREASSAPGVFPVKIPLPSDALLIHAEPPDF